MHGSPQQQQRHSLLTYSVSAHSLVVVVKEDAMGTALALLPFLRPSSTFVVFCKANQVCVCVCLCVRVR